MTLIIKKETYGASNWPVVSVQDTACRVHKPYLLSEFDADDAKEIFAQIEYCLKNNIEVRVEGFRTDKELYPNG